jgi:NAD-dependent DNA ligase
MTKLKILLTGRIKKYTRCSVEKKIKDLGGILTDLPTNADVVIFTRTDTSKYNGAKKHAKCNPSIKFIHGDDFIDYIME